MDEEAAQTPEDNGDNQEPSRNPVFNLPPALFVALCLLAAIYFIQSFLSENAVRWLDFTFGFIPLRYVVPLAQQGPEWLWTPVTYSLLHGSVEHIVFNGLWLMAFGAPVIRRIGTTRFVVFWILSAAASASLHAVLNWGNDTVLIGASGVVSALMGAACRFAFPGRGARGAVEAHHNPRLSILQSMQSRTAVMFTLFWLLANALIAVGVPLVGDGSQEIAWDAHIGGFVFGFFLFAFFDRKPPEEIPN
ncbi:MULTISPECIES: rhomboid family intramembrane serine protease [unclassified Sinorhizobium]|uniref:rhomboid family intramembrane serine protease n=1 Tax=unclassified Sinorhizobium TaxID=2613772 RepID=UPI003526A1BC